MTDSSWPLETTQSVVSAISLLGRRLTHRYRVLQPASSQTRQISWTQVAASRGVAVDLARATWFDVSGVRPFTGRQLLVDGAEVDEPESGPRGVLVDVLNRLSSSDDVHIAQWEGRGQTPQQQVDGEPTQWANRRYLVRSVSFGDLIDGTASGALLPDLAWTDQWLVHADDDLMSIYVSSSAPVDWGTGLEVVRLTGDEPVS